MFGVQGKLAQPALLLAATLLLLTPQAIGGFRGGEHCHANGDVAAYIFKPLDLRVSKCASR